MFRALKKAGLGDEYLAQLDPWREMLRQGLTTWAEIPEAWVRSDCHGWASHPNFDLLTTVAGIEPAASGFRTVKIEPHLGPLKQVKATVPHPAGQISVVYQRRGEGLLAEITLPKKVTGWFVWHGKRLPLRGGYQKLVL